MKRSLGIVVVCLIVVCTYLGIGIVFSEAQAALWGDFEYTESNGEATVTKYNGSSLDVVIPSKMNGYPVTRIGDQAFSGKTDITSILIPDQVTYIGNNAFSGCTGLTQLEFPDEITSIGSSALNVNSYKLLCFAGTTTASTLTGYSSSVGITSPNYPDYRYRQALDANDDPYVILTGYAGSKSSITLPTSIDGIPVKRIGNGISGFTSTAESITVPSGNIHIANYAFSGCTALKTVEIKGGEKAIGNYAFKGCTSLESVIIGNGVQSIGSYAFENCSSLTNVQIADSVASLGSCAFYSCSALISITLPSGLSALPAGDVNYTNRGLFYQCNSLKEIIFPDNISTIGSSGLLGMGEEVRLICRAGTESANTLQSYFSTSALISSESPDYGYRQFTDSNGDLCLSIIKYYGESANAVVPSMIDGIPVKRIGNGSSVFKGSNATSVTISNGVRSISNYAFSDCSAITQIELPNGIQTIGNYAFNNCSSLSSLSVGDGIQSIGEYAFYGCSSLSNLQIANSLTSLGKCAFWSCTSLARFVLPAGLTSLPDALKKTHLNSTGGEYYDYYGLFYNCSRLNELVFPDNLQSLGSGSLIDLKTNVKKICRAGTVSAQTLAGSLLISPDIPDYGYRQYTDSNGNLFLAIGKYYGNNTDVLVPDFINSVPVKRFGDGDSVFSGSSVTSVELPAGIQSIYGSAFSGCTAITSIELPEGIRSIGDNAFKECKELASLEIHNGIQSIGEYAFENCTSLSNLQIANSLTSLGTCAFWGCTSLKRIVLPAGLVSLPDEVIETHSNSVGGDYYKYFGLFYNCTSLKEIVFPDGITDVGGCFVSIKSGVRYICRAGTITANTLAGTSLISPSMPAYKYQQFTDADNQPAVIIEAYLGDDSEVGVPAAIDGVPVKIIGLGSSSVFSNNAGLQTLVIPDGVETISTSALSGCSNLTGLTIGASVAKIGNNAFSTCSALESITLPSALTSLSGTNLFSGCTKLKEIRFPDHITSIVSGSLPSSTTLKYICKAGSDTATTLTSLGSQYHLISESYPDLKWRQEVDGDGNINLMISAYSGNASTIVIPSFINNTPVLSIQNQAFMNQTTLEKVTLPETLISIGESAFSGCSALRMVIFPEYLESIGNFAFQNCAQLDGIILPEWLETIGCGAFNRCTGLTSIKIPQHISELPDRLNNNSYGVFQGCSSLSAVSFCNGLTKIGSYAFYGCDGLTDVSLPESLTELGSYAFYTTTSGKLQRMLVPQEATTFGTSVINGRMTIYCYEDTPGYNWAMSSGCSVVLLDGESNERSISLPESFSMVRGESRQIVAQVFPELDGDVVVWNSSDPDVVRVQDGVLTAISRGTATITATIGASSASVDVRSYVPLEDFEIVSDQIYVVQRDVFMLDVIRLQPEDADAGFTWSSSNETYATVDQTGKVSTKRAGNARITVTSDNGIEKECMVHVCYAVSEITFAQENYEIPLGSTTLIEGTITAGNQTFTNKLVGFVSSDESVATVDADGAVTAHKVGEAVITASAQNDVTASYTVTVLCVEHIPVIDEAVPATCEEPGLTEGSHCEICGEIITAQEEIPALGHDWTDTAYVWAEDNSEVTASRSCKRDPEHTQEETVSVTSEVIQEATCEAEGETLYTSEAFEEEDFTIQTRTLSDIPALGHKWQKATYQWTADYTSITAVRICENDSSHKEEETVESTFIISTPPTATGKGKTTYTAKFTMEGFTKQAKTVSDIPALNSMSMLNLPEQLKRIEANAFEDLACEAVIIPDGCTSIGSKAFADCENLLYVYIPASVTELAENAFEGSNLVKIYREK